MARRAGGPWHGGRRGGSPRTWPDRSWPCSGEQISDSGSTSGGVTAGSPVRAVGERRGGAGEAGSEQFAHSGDGTLDDTHALRPVRPARRCYGVKGAGWQGGSEQQGVTAVGGLGGHQQERERCAGGGGVFVIADDREDRLERITRSIQHRGQAVSLTKAVPGRGDLSHGRPFCLVPGAQGATGFVNLMWLHRGTLIRPHLGWLPRGCGT